MRIVFSKLEKKYQKLLKYRQSIWNILWRILEMHYNKLISFFAVYVALNEVNFLLKIFFMN